MSAVRERSRSRERSGSRFSPSLDSPLVEEFCSALEATSSSDREPDREPIGDDEVSVFEDANPVDLSGMEHFGTERDTFVAVRTLSASMLPGGEVYRNTLGDLPIGPRNLDEMGLLTQRMVNAIASDDRKPGGMQRIRRMFHLLRQGLVLHHDFSGRQGFEQSLKIIEAELDLWGLRKGWLIIWRSTEKVQLSRMSMMSGKLRPEHCFPVVESLHSNAELLEFIRVTRPYPHDDAELWIEYQRKLMEYVLHNCLSIFPKGAVSENCGNNDHFDRMCPIRWEDSREESQRALTVKTMGPHCTPWCRGGGRLGLAHPNQEQYCLAIGESAAGHYDVNLLEESADMPPDHWVAPMARRHKVIYAILGQEDIGPPAYRTRFNGVAVRYSSMVWIGPEGPDVTEHVLSFFQCLCEVDADIFHNQDGEEERLEMMREYAKRKDKGHHKEGMYRSDLASCVTASTTTRDVLPSYALVNLDEYQAARMAGKKVGVSGSVTADISQGIERHRAGPFMPTIQKSSLICALTEDEGLYTCNELSSAHGWPTCDWFPYRYRNTLNYDLSKHRLSHQANLLGDGMSLWLEQAWMLYVFTHTVRRASIEQFDPPLDRISAAQLDRALAKRSREKRLKLELETESTDFQYA